MTSCLNLDMFITHEIAAFYAFVPKRASLRNWPLYARINSQKKSWVIMTEYRSTTFTLFKKVLSKSRLSNLETPQDSLHLVILWSEYYALDSSLHTFGKNHLKEREKKKKKPVKPRGTKFSVSFPAFSFIELTQKQIPTTFSHALKHFCL